MSGASKHGLSGFANRTRTRTSTSECFVPSSAATNQSPASSLASSQRGSMSNPGGLVLITTLKTCARRRSRTAGFRAGVSSSGLSPELSPSAAICIFPAFCGWQSQRGRFGGFLYGDGAEHISRTRIA